MPLLRTLLPFNNHILHRGKRRLLLIITRSLPCTRVSRITSAAGHCPYSAMFSLLRHPCRHIHLRPCRVSRQTLHYKRLRSPTHRLCCSPLDPFLSTSHPHNSTSLGACPSLDPIYCPSSRSTCPMLIPLSFFGLLRDNKAYLFTMAQNDDNSTWHGQKSHDIYHQWARPSDFDRLVSSTSHPLHMSFSHTPAPHSWVVVAMIDTPSR
jgi:hypothetical protein